MVTPSPCRGCGSTEMPMEEAAVTGVETVDAAGACVPVADVVFVVVRVLAVVPDVPGCRGATARNR